MPVRILCLGGKNAAFRTLVNSCDHEERNLGRKGTESSMRAMMAAWSCVPGVVEGRMSEGEEGRGAFTYRGRKR